MSRPLHVTLSVLVLIAVLVLGAVPAVASAQETRAGGIVEVPAGETVQGDLVVTGGTVLVMGTVDGDLEATGGTVVVAGTVTGDVTVFAGSVTVSGTVEGDVAAASGSLVVSDSAVVGGNLDVAAGAVTLDGTVGGSARLAGEDVAVGPTAEVAGDVVYDAQRFDLAPGASVGGTVTRDDDLTFTFTPFDVGGGVGTFRVPTGLIAFYGLLVNLLLGAVALLVAPGFARSVTRFGTGNAARSGAVGLLTFVAVPVALVLLFVTVIGIPLSLVGLVAYAFCLWLAGVYGAFVLGGWLLSLADVTSRWAALLLGLVVVSLLGFVPFGEPVQFVVLLVGLGAFVLALRERWRGRGGDEDDTLQTTLTQGVGADQSESRPTE